ncbi:MAG: DUF2961 domain-containing protein [Planctomycetota bacterium]|nr:MAG: DUF2961 domain-containing protein [Planctomycetota bacterium]
MVLEELSRLRSARRRRESSYDRSGGNFDFVTVPPGGTHVLGELTGPGVIRHLWVTALGDDPHLLRTASLRIYWDGQAEPSVDAPLGDFFGVGFGDTVNFASLPLSMMPQDGKGMNCFFPMPFRRGARVEVWNEGDHELKHLFYYVDWEALPAPLDGHGYFHAWFARENPCRGISDAGMTNWEFQMEGKNPTGEGNYLVLDFAGRGHYVGCLLNVHNLRRTDQNNWYGEGDDMIFLDGDERPTLHGTGTEDYFLTAWGPRQRFCGPFAGMTLPGGVNYSGRVSMYRFHLDDPIMFERSIRVTIEHGHANRRSDDWSTVAYWYAEEPGRPRMPRLAAAERIPWPADHLPGLPCVEE